MLVQISETQIERCPALIETETTFIKLYQNSVYNTF
jgi:hypothetical protein